ncbi:hypothetical protein niasHT_002645 [Heterodera trifolii]|uniref:Uncharacterized protein n=1 Tax=Heterodera trifolii TaxID=157864 RepID=A0ABD2LU80_9BILA
MNRSVFSSPNSSFCRLAFFTVLCSLSVNAMKFAVTGKYGFFLDSPQITGAIRYHEKTVSSNSTTFSLSNSSASVDKNANSCDASIQRISIQFAPLIEGIVTAKGEKWNTALEFTKKDGKNRALSDYSLGVAAFFPAQKASQKSHVYEKNGTAEWVAHLESEQFNHPNGVTCSEDKLALFDASSINFEFLKLLIVFCIWICGRRSGEASGSGRQNSAPVRMNKGGGGPQRGGRGGSRGGPQRGGPQRGGGKGGGAGKGGGRAPVEEEEVGKCFAVKSIESFSMLFFVFCVADHKFDTS